MQQKDRKRHKSFALLHNITRPAWKLQNRDAPGHSSQTSYTSCREHQKKKKLSNCTNTARILHSPRPTTMMKTTLQQMWLLLNNKDLCFFSFPSFLSSSTLLSNKLWFQQLVLTPMLNPRGIQCN